MKAPLCSVVVALLVAGPAQARKPVESLCDKLKPAQSLTSEKEAEVQAQIQAGMVGVGRGSASSQNSKSASYNTQLLQQDDLARAFYIYQLCIMKEAGALTESLHEELMRKLFDLGSPEPAAAAPVAAAVETAVAAAVVAPVAPVVAAPPPPPPPPDPTQTQVGDVRASSGDPALVPSSAQISSESSRSTMNSVSATSVLSSQGSNSYEPYKMTDRNPATAWVEGRSDYGVGESIRFRAGQASNGGGCSGLVIANGYQKTVEHYFKNSRVRSFQLVQNGVARGTLQLDDRVGLQRFDVSLAPDSDVQLVIVDTYAGTKWPDVAISEIWQKCD